MSVPVAPPPCKHSVLSVFQILVILFCDWFYLWSSFRFTANWSASTERPHIPSFFTVSINIPTRVVSLLQSRNSHSNRCAVVSHYCFNLHSPNDILLEKAMAPHSSTLAWKISWMEETGGLLPMGSLSVRHEWVTSLSLFTFMHWRRKWQPTPVFLPGESQGWGSLVGCRRWGHTESEITEAT